MNNDTTDGKLKRCRACRQLYPATHEFFRAVRTCRYGLDSRCKKCRSNATVYKKEYKAHDEFNATQQCIKCGERKPKTFEYFPAGNRSGAIRHVCKECKNKQDRMRRSKRRKPQPTREELNSLPKRCIKCGEEYPATAEYFQRDKNRLSGLFHTCKQCCSARKPESTNPETKKKCRVCNKNFPATPDYFFRDKTKKFGLESCCRWCHSKKEHTPKRKSMRRIVDMKRRTLEYQLPFNFTEQDWHNCLEYFGHKCAVCGRPVGLWHTLAKDHWIPITHPYCPGTIPTNIVPLCHTRKDGEGGCNNLKGNKAAAEWLIRQFGKRKAVIILKRIEGYFFSLRLQGDK